MPGRVRDQPCSHLFSVRRFLLKTNPALNTTRAQVAGSGVTNVKDAPGAAKPSTWIANVVMSEDTRELLHPNGQSIDRVAAAAGRSTTWPKVKGMAAVKLSIHTTAGPGFVPDSDRSPAVALNWVI